MGWPTGQNGQRSATKANPVRGVARWKEIPRWTGGQALHRLPQRHYEALSYQNRNLGMEFH